MQCSKGVSSSSGWRALFTVQYNLESMGFIFQVWQRRIGRPLTPTATNCELWWKLNLWTTRPHNPFADILLLIIIGWLRKRKFVPCKIWIRHYIYYWGFQGGLLKYCPLIRTTSADGIHEIWRWEIFFQENPATFTKCGDIPEWHLRVRQKGFKRNTAPETKINFPN